ncbi:unnamed protein product [Polarella glacialis]|uniref:Uncharacterized protein n=1 Tax=Polarella glacialis TaxID=89957 RepID=A0A813GEF2_POLGL|nr:unnamed protein product [Polarella glacialis]
MLLHGSRHMSQRAVFCSKKISNRCKDVCRQSSFTWRRWQGQLSTVRQLAHAVDHSGGLSESAESLELVRQKRQWSRLEGILRRLQWPVLTHFHAHGQRHELPISAKKPSATG